MSAENCAKVKGLNPVVSVRLKTTSALVVETSVTKNSSFQNYPHPDDHTIRTVPYRDVSVLETVCMIGLVVFVENCQGLL